jgi:hypothetical protein
MPIISNKGIKKIKHVHNIVLNAPNDRTRAAQNSRRVNSSGFKYQGFKVIPHENSTETLLKVTVTDEITYPEGEDKLAGYCYVNGKLLFPIRPELDVTTSGWVIINP